jgi:hypothetical protein
LGKLIDQLSELQDGWAESENKLFDKIADLDLGEESTASCEVRKLKQIFSRIREQFVYNFKQLEIHRTNLKIE